MKVWGMRTLTRVLADPEHKLFGLWQAVVTVFIFASCIALALETVPGVSDRFQREFAVLEWISVSIFTIDYLANLNHAEKKLAYIFSFWGIIDLVSILPSYLMLLNLSALRGTKVLRIVRVARVLRVLKLVRMAVDETNEKPNPILANLRIYLILFFSVLMISSTAMYFIEGSLYSAEAMIHGQQALDATQVAGEEAQRYVPLDPISGNALPEDKRFFTSIPAAMWWSVVTMTSTGYGDMFPVTVGGRIVGGITMIFGLVLFAILFNLIGKTLMVVLFGEKLKPTDEE
jgi:voltage-gated potassium channel